MLWFMLLYIYVVIKAMFGLLINHNISLAIEIVPFFELEF